jgi:hypothetical protein
MRGEIFRDLGRSIQEGPAMMQQWMVLAGLVSALTTACTSLSAQYATRAPEDRSAAQVTKDQAACEQYTNRHPQRLSYRACMVARSYAANIDMDEMGWTIGVAETEPHAPGEVMRDMVDCDRQAHDTKTSDTVPPLTAEQERLIADQTPSRAGGSLHQQHPDEVRRLAACLHEQGYKIVPLVRANPH